MKLGRQECSKRLKKENRNILKGKGDSSNCRKSEADKTRGRRRPCIPMTSHRLSQVDSAAPTLIHSSCTTIRKLPRPTNKTRHFSSGPGFHTENITYQIFMFPTKMNYRYRFPLNESTPFTDVTGQLPCVSSGNSRIFEGVNFSYEITHNKRAQGNCYNMLPRVRPYLGCHYGRCFSDRGKIKVSG